MQGRLLLPWQGKGQLDLKGREGFGEWGKAPEVLLI